MASLVFTRQQPASAAAKSPDNAKVIPKETPISIRTDEAIDSSRSAPGQLYWARVSQDVPDSACGIAIPAGTPAKVLLHDISAWGAAHSPELMLESYSVTAGARGYRVVTSDADMSNRESVGKNRRTAEFGGGGSGLGALIGAIVGRGKGAAVGAAGGAGAGPLTQLITRGKEIKIPADSVLAFRLDRPLAQARREACPGVTKPGRS